MDRFDDVRVVHFSADEVEPSRPPGRRRWMLVAAALVALVGGSGTAGAAGDGTASQQRPGMSRNADGVPFVRDGHECKAGEGKRLHRRGRAGAAPTVKY